MPSVDLIDVKGKKSGSVDLPEALFDVQTNVPLIHQVVVAQLAAARQGTQSTLRRGEVSGSGKKPFKQKGTRPCSSGFCAYATAPRRWHHPRSKASFIRPAHPKEDDCCSS